jgi:hypothetical protein
MRTFAAMLMLCAVAAGCRTPSGGQPPDSGPAPNPQVPMVRELDLAAPVALRPVQPGVPFTLRVRSVLPGVGYDVSLERVAHSIPPLQLPRLADRTQEGVQSDECDAPVEVLRRRLERATTEIEVRGAFLDLDRAELTSCARQLQPYFDRTMIEFAEPLTLQPGEQIVVTVSRPSSQGDPARWRFVFDAGLGGAWHTSYGFTFIARYDREFSRSRYRRHLPNSLLRNRMSRTSSSAPLSSCLPFYSRGRDHRTLLAHGRTG